MALQLIHYFPILEWRFCRLVNGKYSI